MHLLKQTPTHTRHPKPRPKPHRHWTYQRRSKSLTGFSLLSPAILKSSDFWASLLRYCFDHRDSPLTQTREACFHSSYRFVRLTQDQKVRLGARVRRPTAPRRCQATPFPRCWSPLTHGHRLSFGQRQACPQKWVHTRDKLLLRHIRAPWSGGLRLKGLGCSGISNKYWEVLRFHQQRRFLRWQDRRKLIAVFLVTSRQPHRWREWKIARGSNPRV